MRPTFLSLAALLGATLLHADLFAQQVGVSERPAPASIAVMVLLGPDMNVTRIGTTVFGNDRWTVRTPDDALATAVYKGIESHLISERRYSIKRISVDQTRLPAVSELAYKGATRFFGASLSDVEPEIKRDIAACACDAVLVVTGSRGEVDPNSGIQHASITWLARAFNDEVRLSMVVAKVHLFLVDPRTGATYSSARNSTDQGTILHGARNPPSAWPPKETSLTSEQLNIALNSLIADVRNTVRRPLFEFGLLPSCTEYFYDVTYPPSVHNRRDVDPPPPRPVAPPGSESGWCSQ